MLKQILRGLLLLAPGHSTDVSEGDTKFVPPLPDIDPADRENRWGWGFEDSQFEITPAGNVVLTGDRYNISGVEMPHLLEWMGEILQSDMDPGNQCKPIREPTIPEANVDDEFADALSKVLDDDQYTREDAVRLSHGHGQTQEEIYAINYGDGFSRIPDLVVYPTEHGEVEDLVELAADHGVVLIPYGGGTSVTQALQCPEDEQRTIVSVDMRRMNRILWIDPVNRMACIQAGAVGRHIEEQLGEYGFTTGHEPDSLEFSTIGGWVATHASGMKKNRYGNIEDIVVDMKVVTPRGTIARQRAVPRESTGVDPRLWMYGSEGNLGIVTEVTVNLHEVPDVQRFGSVLFPSFEDGFAFMYELAQTECVPASVRLMDNTQFHFGQALKPEKQRLEAVKSRLEELYITRLQGFDPDEMVAATLLYEGQDRQVDMEQETVREIAERHGGVLTGAENGRRGYELTFGIAYIRDLVFRQNMVAESFETSVSWSKAVELFRNVKRRTHREHRERGIPGTPFITGRVTQIYESGVCLYFYLGFYAEGVDEPTKVFHEYEAAVRQEILDSGGSLSHHHGIGKLRAEFMDDIMSEPALESMRKLKEALDPTDVFGAANQAIRNEGSQ